MPTYFFTYCPTYHYDLCDVPLVVRVPQFEELGSRLRFYQVYFELITVSGYCFKNSARRPQASWREFWRYLNRCPYFSLSFVTVTLERIPCVVSFMWYADCWANLHCWVNVAVVPYYSSNGMLPWAPPEGNGLGWAPLCPRAFGNFFTSTLHEVFDFWNYGR